MLVSGPFAQEIQHVVSVVNIEILVRVFKGDAFVDHLTLQDFEVLENGVPQTIESVYLIKKTEIKREDGKKGAAPQVNRQFVLFFEMSEYLPELDKTLDRFFNEVFLPGDSLIVITPRARYLMRPDALTIPRQKLKDQLRAKLRRDILAGSSEYLGAIRDLEAALSNDSTLEEKIDLYSTYLSKLETLRRVDEASLLQFGEFLKSTPGQKYVYLFYQKELIPKFNPKLLMQTMSINQGDTALTFKLMENFQFFTREVRFNVEAVKKAYADSSIAIHFLYVTKTPASDVAITSQNRSGLEMTEQSEDIFSAFKEIAGATGGISDSSANAASAFQRAVAASENYYLIYYKPKDYKADGQFRELKVNVKGGGYRIMHRAGYIAK
jgi:VWFA-related protein